MWPNPQFSADLVTFTEEILDGKLYFLCNEKFLVAISLLYLHTKWGLIFGHDSYSDVLQDFEKFTFSKFSPSTSKA